MEDAFFSVADQVVLVSGASRGIGRGIADGFARRGAKVVVTGRERATLEETARAIGARPIVCDVADPKAVDRLVDAVFSEFGRVDTLLNVAGVNRRRKAERLSEDDWDFILGVNLKGPFLLSTAVGRRMLEAGRGGQINILSLNNRRPLAGVMPYAASKAGLEQMTRALAAEWGPRGVRVNGIAPGFILTDLTRTLYSQPAMKEWMLANTPLRRVGAPSDLVGAALFLASEASAFVTGQVLYVDGGCTAGWAWPIDLESP